MLQQQAVYRLGCARPASGGARDTFRPFLRHFEPIPANFRFTSGRILARWVPFDASHQYESNGGLPSRIGPPEPELASNSGQLPAITRALLEMASSPTQNRVLRPREPLGTSQTPDICKTQGGPAVGQIISDGID